MKVTYNIVELCRTSDKNARYFVQQAEQQRYDVFEFRGNYVIVLMTFPSWSSPDAKFSSIGSGVYHFQ